ncbi:MAG: hypothetical protein ACJZ8O_05470 [Pirellulaceae bacterium]
MNLNTVFARKVAYITAIVLLLFPLFMLGQPATQSAESGKSSSGGKLAQLRASYGLSQSSLGEVDPVSSSLQLATFGMRPIAIIVLWHKATKYQEMEDFDNVTATVNQIAKLQPHFTSIWKFQAHNLAYNISVEFDDYKHRYEWVKRGIRFLMDGTRYNQSEPKLFEETGNYIGQKIGRSDEKHQFRSLFNLDTAFHDEVLQDIDETALEINGPNGNPDNWLVSKVWYRQGEQVYNRGDDDQFAGILPVVFFANRPRSQIYYAIALEEDGILNEVSRAAFSQGHDEWEELGAKELRIPAEFHGQFGDINIRMSEYADYARQADEAQESLYAVDQNLYDDMVSERRLKLTKAESHALETDPAVRSDYLKQLAYKAEGQLFIDPQQYIIGLRDKVEEQPESFGGEEAAEDTLKEAARIAERVLMWRAREMASENYLGLSNYQYWLTRCKVEQTKDATDARIAVQNADRLFPQDRLEEARVEYEKAWNLWGKIFKDYPQLESDELAENLMPSLAKYVLLLEQYDEEIGDDFVLKGIINRYRFAPELEAGGIQFPTPENPDGAVGEIPTPPTE